MCGIAGIWKLNNSSVSNEELMKFTDSIAHRGPDGSGYWINSTRKLGLGHRRLSILDVSENANQPMKNASEDLVIVYNGEIFNFIELKKELSKNYNFKTSSDTEVILAAYKQWGEKCVYKFNGMWAFAIYNTKTNSLFLSRDRWGIKPLYYSYTATGFYFASETIAFRHLEGFNRRVNDDLLKRAISAADSLEGFGYTIFEGINSLLPGHSMKVETGKTPKQEKWWDTRKNLVQVPASYEDQKEEFFQLFKSSCGLRLRSDVPVGTALSGGVDSSAVYCMLKHIEKTNSSLERVPQDWKKAFIAVFPGEIIDEKKYAEFVLNHTHSTGNFIEVDYGNLGEQIFKSTYLFDAINDSPINAVANIYQGMRNQGIRVSMDGHGVDEMMYGYKMLARKMTLQAGADKNQARAQDLKNTYLQLFFESEQQKQADALEKDLQTASDKKSALSSLKRMILKKLKNPDLFPVHSKQFLNPFSNATFQMLTNNYDDFSDLNGADRLTYNTFHTSTLPTILRNFDRASMQSSIEVRMPFMDYRLVTYIFSLPKTSLIGNGFTKKILRDSLSSIMPHEITNRQLKLGFPVPLETWIKTNCKELFLDTVSSRTFLESSVWEGKKIKEWAETNYKNNLWTGQNVNMFWLYINAHIISSN